jgi:hypothetical protein
MNFALIGLVAVVAFGAGWAYGRFGIRPLVDRGYASLAAALPLGVSAVIAVAAVVMR